MPPDADPTHELTILVPCYNEVLRLRDTVEQILRHADDTSTATRLVLIDDGSSDATGALIAKIAEKDSRVKPLLLPVNRGKGAALRAGARVARSPLVAFLDADLSYPLEGLERAKAAIEAGADIVIGGRDLQQGGSMQSYSAARKLSSLAFNSLVDLMLGLHIPDTQCGFKVFRGPVAQALFREGRIERFGFDVELLYLAKRWGLRIQRIPVTMSHRTGSTVRVVRDGARMAYDLLRIKRVATRGGYSERMPGDDRPVTARTS